MNDSTLKLTIATVEGQAFSGEVSKLSVPTVEGEITVLPHHMALMTALGTGGLTIYQSGSQMHMVVDRGIMQIEADGVTILTELAERAEDIEEAKVEEARQRAVSLKSEKADRQDLLLAEIALRREIARLKVARKYKKGAA